MADNSPYMLPTPIPHQKDDTQENEFITKKTEIILRRVWSVDKYLSPTSNLTVSGMQDATSAKWTCLKRQSDHSSSSSTVQHITTYSLNEILSSGLIVLSTKAIEYQKHQQQAWRTHSPPAFWVVGKVVQETPKT